MKILVVVDMQNDFVDGALGSAEAQAIVPRVVEKIKNFDGMVLATRDTHQSDYLKTQEGKNLPVEHCIEGTDGWQICPKVAPLLKEEPIDKPAFGSVVLGERLRELNERETIESVTLIGLCTDICVISNAMILKANLPEVPILVDADCCAGVTVESHMRALEAMKVCQIQIVEEK
ncbi:MAG: cysteine hydrolase [Acetatifactor sp.]|nr:cysteine hydrolase [Acetatifactor sp.]MDE6701713.1 cysteine hydrolase [Acetatifactor sp.]MDE7112831.1 cysteine hydrolase [Acetatifactor sp.]